jgi:uncharacterized membrane protein
MSKFALVVFPDEAMAYQGFHALDELHGARSGMVYGAAVIARDENGALCIKKRTAEVPLGVRLGVLVGGLGNEFLESVRRELVPGTFAVIVEASEWIIPLDAQMEALGGRVVCEWWDGRADRDRAQRARAPRR